MIKTNCFKGSGLTEIPAALREYARQSAKCPSSYKGIFAGCYNLAGIGKEFINPALFIGDKTITDMLYAKMEMEKIKEMYDGLKAFIDGKESRIKAVESVSFVYKFEPVEITRIQMGSRWYVMSGNEMQEYNQYMEQHFKNKEDISGLQADSFSRENEKELAQGLCDKQLQKLEKAQLQYEKAFGKFSKAQSEFKPLCDKAQLDTKERTDAVNRDDNDAR
jgi:hypothetical protein